MWQDPGESAPFTALCARALEEWRSLYRSFEQLSV